MNVMTTSQTSAAVIEYLPGEWASKPFDANPPAREKSALPLAITYSTPAAATAPATCETMYGARSDDGKRPPANSPIETAGLK